MKHILSAVLWSSFYLSTQAYALPILRESAATYDSMFVTIYPDHRNPNLYYFLPNSMQFAKDPVTGVPDFSLNTYGAEQSDPKLAKGWITFVFRAAVTPDVQAALNSFKKDHPGAILATLPVGESYLTVGTSRDGVPSSGGADWFKSWDLPPYGGVFESEVGGNAYLTGEGAKMMSTIVFQPKTSFSLNYCFKVDGVTPNMDARVVIDYQKVFTHFKTSAKTGWLWWGGEVTNDVRKLVENGSISIALHGDTKFEDVVFQMARDFAKDYLKSTLDSTVGGGSSDTFPFRFARFGFNAGSTEERRTVTLDIRKQADLTDVRCIAAPFRDVAPYASKIVTNVPR